MPSADDRVEEPQISGERLYLLERAQAGPVGHGEILPAE